MDVRVWPDNIVPVHTIATVTRTPRRLLGENKAEKRRIKLHGVATYVSERIEAGE